MDGGEAIENHMSKAVRNPDGTFARGPGRKLGSKNRMSREAIEKIKSLGPLAFEQLELNLSRADQRAVEFVLNRILPAGRMLEIDPTPEGIRDHLAAGDFSESEARAVASVIEKLQKIDRLEELERKLENLENLLRGSSL